MFSRGNGKGSGVLTRWLKLWTKPLRDFLIFRYLCLFCRTKHLYQLRICSQKCLYYTDTQFDCWEQKCCIVSESWLAMCSCFKQKHSDTDDWHRYFFNVCLLDLSPLSVILFGKTQNTVLQVARGHKKETDVLAWRNSSNTNSTK